MRSKIGRRILGNYLLMTLLLGMVAVFAYWQVTRIRASAQVLEEEFRELNYISEAEANFWKWTYRLRELAREREELGSEEIAALISQCREPLARLQRIVADPKTSSGEFVRGHEEKERDILSGLRSMFGELESLASQMAGAGQTERTGILRQILAKAEDVETHLEDFKRNDNEEAQNALSEANRIREQALVGLVSAIVVAALLSLFAGVRFALGLIRPIEILRDGAARIRRGELSHRIHLKTGDELEQFSEEFNDMARRLAEVHQQQSDEIDTRTRQLVHSQKLAAIGTLAAGVAHEMNNPLASIAGYAEGLRRRAKNPSLQSCKDFKDYPHYLDVIIEETYRCKQITRNLLDFARQGEAVFGPVEVNNLLAKTCELVRHQPGMSGKQLGLELTEEPLVVEADESQLRHAFFNILRNACEAIEEGGEVSVRTMAIEECITIEIEDNGKGIAREVLPRVIEPFFTTKPPGQGTGLGLSVAHGIMETHGGRLEILSGGLGKGCLVTLVLPRSQAALKVGA